MNPSTITRAHKNSVRAATIENITLSGVQTIDQVSLVVGDRVLVKDQTDARQNGIWLVSTSAWVRAPDMDQSDEVLPGLHLYVAEGTQNAEKFFYLKTILPITLGNTNLEFGAALTAGSESGGVTDHGALSGLADDDHPQYQLRSEKGSSSGYASLDSSSHVPTNQLGSGTANSTTVLHGDNTWSAVDTIPSTRTITAGAGLTGGGDLSSNRTIDVVANADGSIIVNANDIQVGVLATNAQHGTRSGGTLHSVATGSTAGFMSSTDKTKLDGLPTNAVPTTTQVIAGEGLTGGGALSSNVTVNIGQNADGSITVNSNDIQVGILATDAQHGNRGNGSLHTVATSGVAGFMSAADKVTLDSLVAGTVPTTRVFTAGSGLTGGGDFSADRTFNVGTNVDGSIIVNADDIQVGILASDTQHGNRGGGSLHDVATTGMAGFMSGDDKFNLDFAASYLPDPILATQLVDDTSYQIRYFGSTGSDTTGDGSFGNPYRDIQRCINSIPTRCVGVLEFRALDAGPFTGNIYIPNLEPRLDNNIFGFTVNFVGAGDSQLSLIGGPAATQDANPTGGFKQSRVRYAGVGAHPTITNGSHWIKAGTTFGGFYPDIFSTGFTIDGENSESPDISVICVPTYDILSQGWETVDLIPFTSRLDPVSGGPILLKAADQNTIISFVGFYTEEQNVLIQGAIGLQGCAKTNSAGSLSLDSRGHLEHVINIFTASETFIRSGLENFLILYGLFLGKTWFVSGSFGVTATFRTTNSIKLFIGGTSPAGPHQQAGIDLQADFEDASVTCIYAVRASVRLYDDGAQSTTDGQSANFIIAESQTMINSREDGQPCVFGSTTSYSLILSEGSQTRGLLGHGTSPALRNATISGHDIALGNIDIAFSDVPSTDLSTLTRAG